ncbi:GlcG/HbpS family heme-binding protein (plasmid) [Nitrobacteraceae bacterium UC4446_H13]
MRAFFKTALIVSTVILSPALAYAQQAPAIGAPISLKVAEKLATSALAEASKNNWNMAVAIVEPSGQLVYFAKMDGTQYGSINVALDKATSAALYRRPTEAFNAGLKGGNTYLLQLRGSNAVPGGFPIVIEGKLVGAIGASGGSGEQDTQTSQAGLAALK